MIRPERLIGLILFSVLTALSLVVGCVGGPADSQTADSRPPATAAQVLERSIRYHDPAGAWFVSTHRMTSQQTRPNGPARKVDFVLPPEEQHFEIAFEEEGVRLAGVVTENGFQMKAEPSEEETIKRFRKLDHDGVLWWRDYYGYLVAAPMNLRDDGAILAPEFKRESFQGVEAYVLSVGYGDDQPVWEYYVDPTDFRLLACRFSTAGQREDGELIEYEGEIVADGIRIPRKRTWSNHSDGKVIGVDELVGYARFVAGSAAVESD